jgi:uncharacterized repeat protein (TIGR03803 family)
MKNLGLCSIASIVAAFCVATVIASPAQNFKRLASFNGKNGGLADVALVQGLNGNFYGTSYVGGAHQNNQYCAGDSGCGTVFEVTSAGKLTTIYNFCSRTNCADGALPNALVLATNGNFYGTTQTGGTNGGGTVFEITPAGKLTTLYRFCATNCADGADPGPLVQAADGNLSGATVSGGIFNGDAGCPNGCGTIFKITPKGALTTLYSFCPIDGQCPDGQFPVSVTQASNGNFYGVTQSAGANGRGTVFEMTPLGDLTTLHSFCQQSGCPDGNTPLGMLMQAANGKLYGTTEYGGSDPGGGTVYEITLAGNLTILYNFCSQANCTDGSNPIAGLVQGTDGNFYGTTWTGGNAQASLCSGSGCGTVFELTPAGKLTTLYGFCPAPQKYCTDGAYPVAGLVQATTGTLYGVADKGGADYVGCVVGGGCGDVFSLSVRLGPFVETNPASGEIGQAVTILGNHLKGTTAVGFNGTPATFTVVSDTEIKTSVPSGATTGFVKVTTPTKTLKSKAVFRVTK